MKLNNTKIYPSPKISIITITFNSELFLEKTILSIIQQRYKDKEYIIIDGASTDATLDIIKKYEAHIDLWTSEPDKGIADAMNKGVKSSKGNYILFLHSDDYFLDENTLEKATNFLDNNHDMFLFNIYYSADDYKILAKPRGLTFWTNFKTGVLHQGCICTRNLFSKIGNFDTKFRIAMDYDFFLRAYHAGVQAKYIDLPISVMRKTGISSQLDWPNLKKRFKEEREVHKKYCPNILMKMLYQVYWSGYLPYRYLRYHLK